VSLFKKKSSAGQRLIVDVGHQYVKVIDLFVQNDTARLHDFRILDIVQGSGERYENKEIAKYIKKALLDMKVSSKLVYTSMAGQQTLVRFVDMPKMSVKELKSAIRYQGMHMPFKLTDAYYDAQVLPDEAVAQGKMKVIVAASHKKDADELLELLRGVGLIPCKLDVDGIALTNAYLWGGSQADDGLVALVNIGATRTNLTILSKKTPTLCRELSHGGVSFTQSISDGLGIEFSEAEEKKVLGEEAVLPFVQEALKPLTSGLLQSFEFFEGTSGMSVSKVFLSGGGAQIRGITDYLKEGLGRNVVLWNPLRNINIDTLGDKEKELLRANSHILAVGLGIGLGEGRK